MASAHRSYQFLVNPQGNILIAPSQELAAENNPKKTRKQKKQGLLQISPDDGGQRPPGAFPTTDFSLPTVTTEIIRIASERHQKGLMQPMIYQLLTQGEVKLPVVMEDDASRELPSYVDLYRPIRQTIYSVLFNLNKLKIVHENTYKEKGEAPPPRSFEVAVKEWVVRRGGMRPSYEVTVAKPVEWKTPSIERMWLGKNADDKNRRLRAFLTIMHSDTPLLLNTQYVPQHLLLMCCVLR
nr:hypothetical protein BaRGS_024234 [Batillaria attramentaria]